MLNFKKLSNPLITTWVKCYIKLNNDRLPSVVLQLHSNLSASSDFTSNNNNSNITLSVQSSNNDISSNDGVLFQLSIIDIDYHIQGITTDVIINFEKNTNDSLQQKRVCYIKEHLKV